VLQTTADTDRAGTGVHRQFETRELQLAALLVPLAATGMAFGVLRESANVLRTALYVKGWKWSESGEARDAHDRALTPGFMGLVAHLRDHREISEALARAERREGRNYLMLAYLPQSVWTDVATDSHGPICMDPVKSFAEADLPKSAAIIILDLTKILGSLTD
jgi:hypothetical protein